VPTRPCLKTGCRKYATSGAYCPAHTTRRSGHPAYADYGPAYQAKRRELLAGSPLCYWCKRRKATEADHLVPQVRGGGHDQMVPSCRRCNRSRGGGEAKSSAREHRTSSRGAACAVPKWAETCSTGTGGRKVCVEINRTTVPGRLSRVRFPGHFLDVSGFWMSRLLGARRTDERSRAATHMVLLSVPQGHQCCRGSLGSR
jgi:hypothetical protein